jgi:hypothetical protein
MLSSGWPLFTLLLVTTYELWQRSQRRERVMRRSTLDFWTRADAEKMRGTDADPAVLLALPSLPVLSPSTVSRRRNLPFGESTTSRQSFQGPHQARGNRCHFPAPFPSLFTFFLTQKWGESPCLPIPKHLQIVWNGQITALLFDVGRDVKRPAANADQPCCLLIPPHTEARTHRKQSAGWGWCHNAALERANGLTRTGPTSRSLR